MQDGPFYELLESHNLAIADMAMKCEAVFSAHEHAHVGISGGADSDVMLDVCERVRKTQPIEITYDFHDTGMEYRATKTHLDYLERRYGIKIHRTRAKKTIPVCCHDYGQPFLSKMVSEQIERAQIHGFKWDDLPLEELEDKYPDMPKSVLKWWTNGYTKKDGTISSSYCVGGHKLLKEFIVQNPPNFRISRKCCTYAKKQVGKSAIRAYGADLDMVGVRRAEGGVRAISNKCFDKGTSGHIDRYKPLYWLSDSDKKVYDEKFSIQHSDCYAVWGFKRTGCVGCPFNRQVFDDLKMAEPYEPNVVRAANKIFGQAYEYTQKFREFKESMSAK